MPIDPRHANRATPRGLTDAESTRAKRLTRPPAKNGGGHVKYSRVSAAKAHEVRVAQALNGNARETARQTGVMPQTVKAIIRRTPPAEWAEERDMAIRGLAESVQAKAEQILDQIVEHDMVSEVYVDADGVRHVRGPSLVQKTTAFAILADKLKILEEHRRTITASAASGPMDLPLPETVAGTLDAIRGRLRRLQLVNIEFEPVKKAKQALEKAVRTELPADEGEAVDELNFDCG